MSKTLYDISWQVDEPTYRKDPAISYSTLSAYEREGFESLFGPPLKTPSLTFGSVVDTMVTDGMDAFNNRYVVLNHKCSPTLLDVLQYILKNSDYSSLDIVSDELLLEAAAENNYYPRYKAETICSKLKTQENAQILADLYTINTNCPTKEIISLDVYDKALLTYRALKISDDTKWYFFDGDDGFERYYQLKFKGTIEGVDYRCMADLIIVDKYAKKIIPCDLKTTGKPESMFWGSFHKWYYFYQAKLYWNLIRQNLDKDEEFKDYELLPYRFIVVNNTTLTPMVYTYEDTRLRDYTYEGVTYRNPSTVGKELRYLLDERKKEMNKEEMIKAIETVKSGLGDLQNAIMDMPEHSNEPIVDLRVVAKSIATHYKTTKNNIGADNLLNNIKSMAHSDKCKILLAWMSASPLELIKNIRSKPIQDQILLVQQAVDMYPEDIKEILMNKYGA